ncbi:MAG: helix-turn-helix domain-containing protein [Candidatus Omnitrophica bacterium]|nr:helix-turn-helix domain-containing protein [Candidatus Omnitrophota bacterium]
MITLIVVEEEKRIYDLLSSALATAGYAFVDELASGGLVKIIKRMNQQGSNLGANFFDSGDYIKKNNGGELYKATVTEMEKSLISSVLARTEGNQLKAAKILGINRNTLRSKIKKLGIQTEQWKAY